MDGNLKEASSDLLAEMRDAFDAHDWDSALALFQQLLRIKPDRAKRLEATCLAVRAQTHKGQRRRARELIKELDGKVYKKPVHYGFLAYAYLELRQYENAAKACERAEALRVAEEPTG
jgi:tetratricopeptide (TPR) repeat protein